ncbi:MAG: hypothetical protein AB7F25_10965 [Deferribacterales bacterium]
MHRIRQAFQSYKLLIAFSSMIFTLSVLLICIETVNSSMEDNITDLRRTAAQYKPDKTREKLTELENALDAANPPYPAQIEAKRLLLETLENFRTLYGGKILNDITDQGGSFSADLEFEIQPTDPSQITGIINYLENSIAPVITVKKLSFSRSNDKNTVRFLISANQPYYGGVYEY